MFRVVSTGQVLPAQRVFRACRRGSPRAPLREACCPSRWGRCLPRWGHWDENRERWWYGTMPGRGPPTSRWLELPAVYTVLVSRRLQLSVYTLRRMQGKKTAFFKGWCQLLFYENLQPCSKIFRSCVQLPKVATSPGHIPFFCVRVWFGSNSGPLRLLRWGLFQYPRLMARGTRIFENTNLNRISVPQISWFTNLKSSMQKSNILNLNCCAIADVNDGWGKFDSISTLQ